MDIFATVCLAVTALTMIVTSFWIGLIALDVRKARRALEEMADKARSGDLDASGGPSWSSADAA